MVRVNGRRQGCIPHSVIETGIPRAHSYRVFWLSGFETLYVGTLDIKQLHARYPAPSSLNTHHSDYTLTP